jgi:hypothetical protein
MRPLLVVLLALLVAAPAFAHGGGEPLVFVPLDHVTQGEKFPVVGADLDPSTTVTLTLDGERLGTAKTDDEGHFKTLVATPADFPDGYVELKVAGVDGDGVSTFVRVGADPVATPAQPTGATSDDGLPVLAAVLIGLAVVAAATGAYLLLRRR